MSGGCPELGEGAQTTPPVTSERKLRLRRHQGIRFTRLAEPSFRQQRERQQLAQPPVCAATAHTLLCAATAQTPLCAAREALKVVEPLSPPSTTNLTTPCCPYDARHPSWPGKPAKKPSSRHVSSMARAVDLLSKYIRYTPFRPLWRSGPC